MEARAASLPALRCPDLMVLHGESPTLSLRRPYLGVFLVLAFLAPVFHLQWRIWQLVKRVIGLPDDPYSLLHFYVPALLSWLLYSIPAAMIGLWAYRKLGCGDRETRCRRCGYILRGLTEPRCTECAEWI